MLSEFILLPHDAAMQFKNIKFFTNLSTTVICYVIRIIVVLMTDPSDITLNMTIRSENSNGIRKALNILVREKMIILTH